MKKADKIESRRRLLVDIISATHQQGIHAIVDALHAFDASALVKVGETADIALLSLFFAQSSCPHIV